MVGSKSSGVGENINLFSITNLSYDPKNPSNPGDTINFYGILPDEITESHSTEFDPVPIRGRSSPLVSYGGSGARTVSLSFDVHEDYLSFFEGNDGSSDIRDFVSKLKTLTYPVYDGVRVVPPRLRVRIGDFFKMRAYCTSISVTWKKPIRQKRFIVASISMELSEIVTSSYSAADIYNMTYI